MPDKRKKVAANRDSDCGGEKYKVGDFAKKHGISEADARRIINQHGSDRDSADRAANRLKG